MKNLTQYLLLITIGLLLYFIFKPIKKEPKVIYDYETDIIELKKTFKSELNQLKKELKGYKETPPKIEYRYTKEKSSNKIQTIKDSTVIIIDTITQSITSIDKNFILSYPQAPKLLRMGLDSDLLSMTLLNISGNILEEEYPMDFNNYTYIYNGAGLNYKKKKPTKWKIPLNLLYAKVGYEFIDNNPYIGLDYQILLTDRLSIITKGDIFLSKEPTTLLQIGMGYRLLK